MTVLLGVNTVGTDGNDFEVGNNGPNIGSFYVAAANGVIDTITLRTHNTNTCTHVHAGIFANSAGTPGARIGNIVNIPLTTSLAAWQTSATGVGATVVSGTTYWIVFWSADANNIVFRLHDATTASGTKDCTTGQTDIVANWPGTLGTFTELMNAYAEDAGVAAAADAGQPFAREYPSSHFGAF